MEDEVAAFIEHLGAYEDKYRQSVRARMRNSDDGLPNKTDRAWIQTMAKDVRSFPERDSADSDLHATVRASE